MDPPPRLDRLARHHPRIEQAFFRSSRPQIAKRTQCLALNERVLEADDYRSAEDLEDGALCRVLRQHDRATAAEPPDLAVSAH